MTDISKVRATYANALQTQSEQLNWASGNTRIKEEIEHMKNLMSESQKALLSVVTAISQMQEQVRG